MNAVETEQAISTLSEQPFDPASFPFAFLEAFSNKATTLKRLKSDRQFLLGFKAGEPDWALYPLNGLENMAALKRKLQNIQKLRILVIPITGTGFIRSPDLPNATGPMVSL